MGEKAAGRAMKRGLMCRAVFKSVPLGCCLKLKLRQKIGMFCWREGFCLVAFTSLLPTVFIPEACEECVMCMAFLPQTDKK